MDNVKHTGEKQLCALESLWSATGAVVRELECYRALLNFVPNRGSVAEYNDSHTHEQVLALFDRAIQAAETQS